MKFTYAAQEMLDTIDDEDRRSEVSRRARHIATAAGRTKVWIEDVTSAIYCADDEFLPEIPEE